MTTLKGTGELFLEALGRNDATGTVMVEADIGATFTNLDLHVEHPLPVDEFFHAPDAREREALDTLLSFDPASVLDIGAGSGRISLWFAGRGVRVTPCEVDADFVRYCRSRGLEGVRDEPFQRIDARYDAVVLFGEGVPTLGPVDDADAHLDTFLDDLLDRVRPGGHLLLDTTEYNSERLLGERTTVVARLRYRLGDLISPAAHYLYPHRSEMVRRLEARGARLVREWRVPYPEAQIEFRWLSIWNTPARG